MICEKCGNFRGSKLDGKPWFCECREFTFTREGDVDLTLYASDLREAAESFGKINNLAHPAGYETTVTDSEGGERAAILIKPRIIVKYDFEEAKHEGT